MFLSLSPNSLYRQTTDCTEGGGLTREHCIQKSPINFRTLRLHKNLKINFRTRDFCINYLEALNIYIYIYIYIYIVPISMICYDVIETIHEIYWIYNLGEF